MKLSKLLTSKILLGMSMLAFVAQTFAATLVAEKLSPALKDSLEQRGAQAVRALKERPDDATAVAAVEAVVRESVPEATVANVRAEDDAVRFDVANNGQTVSVLASLLPGGGVSVGVGPNAAPPAPPAGGAFVGEHDPASIARVAALAQTTQPVSLRNSFNKRGTEGQGQLEAIKTALKKALTDSIDTARLRKALEAKGVTPDKIDAVIQAVTKNYANLDAVVNRLLDETQVMNDPENQFLVAFVTADGRSVAYYEQKFLEANATRVDDIAHHMTHEDIEEALVAGLTQAGVALEGGADLPHQIITAIQTELVAPSVVGRENSLHDAALLYRLSLHENPNSGFKFSNAQDLADALALRSYYRLTQAQREEIARVLAAVTIEETGVEVTVTGSTVKIGEQVVTGALADGIIALVGNAGKLFLNAALLKEGTVKKGVEATRANLVAFLIRAAATAERRNARDTKLENALLVAQVNAGQAIPADPRVAVIDVDALVGDINYAEILNADGTLKEDGALKLSKLVANVGPSIVAKMNQIRAQKGDITFVVASNRLPQVVLEYVLQAMDATTQGSPVAIAFTNAQNLLEQVTARVNAGRTEAQAKFAARANNVLFYVSEANEATYRVDSFGTDQKTLKVQQAQGGQRVSIALLLAGVELLYIDDRAQALGQLRDIYLAVIEGMRSELSDDEYAELTREAQAISGGVIPAVKILDPDQMIQGISDSMATAVAVQRFA